VVSIEGKFARRGKGRRTKKNMAKKHMNITRAMGWNMLAPDLAIGGRDGGVESGKRASLRVNGHLINSRGRLRVVHSCSSRKEQS
jgi:hypothetical protein